MQKPASLRRRTAMLLACGIAFALILFPTTAPEAVGTAFRLCFTTLIPALFPLFVLTGFLTELGMSDRTDRRGLLCRLLGVSPAGKAVWIIGIIAGFPHAARIAAKQVERGRITREEADRVTAFSSVAGPAFVIGGIGQGMLGSTRAGVILYAIQLAASLLTALTLRLLSRPCVCIAPAPKSDDPPPLSPLALLASSIRDGAQAMLTVCAAVTFFSVLRGLAARFLPMGTSLLILSGFLEITTCAAACVEALPRELLCVVLSLLCAWSGCSVHAQVALLSDNRFPLRHYWVGKLLMCLYSIGLGVIFHNFL